MRLAAVYEFADELLREAKNCITSSERLLADAEDLRAAMKLGEANAYAHCALRLRQIVGGAP